MGEGKKLQEKNRREERGEQLAPPFNLFPPLLPKGLFLPGAPKGISGK